MSSSWPVWLLLLTACGATESNATSDAGGAEPNSATADDGAGGTGNGSTSGGGGDASTSLASTTSTSGSGGTGTLGASSNGSGGAGGTEPTEPLDPSIFDPLDPTEPRTDGDRVTPGPRADCPDREPTAGADCDGEGLTCTYGAAANWACRRKYVCESEWVRYGADCVVPSDAYCSDEPAPGLACPGPQGTCEFDSMICYCPSCDRSEPCTPPDQPRWICITPPADLDCPLLPPNVGEGCSPQAHRCVYGNPCAGNGVIVFCREGVWEEEPKACDE
ncbi:MAG TPA: hypothetical protein VI197_29785 [Polyangiaceae bacterium]